MKHTVHALIFCLLLLAPSLKAQTLNFRNFSVKDGLNNSTVYYSMQDRRGFVWFATESGVNRFDGYRFENFTMDNGLSDNEVLLISEDSRGRVWFLTLNGRLSYYQNGKFHNPENTAWLRKAITSSSFVSFFEDSRGRCWFGTNQQQIIMIDGTVPFVFPGKAYETDLINSIFYEDPQQNIWALSAKGFFRFSNGNFARTAFNEFPLNHKAFIYNKGDKSILYLGKQGIMRFDSRKTELIRPLGPEISGSNITSFLVDNTNTLWISTLGRGIFLFKENSTVPERYLSQRYISHLMTDAENDIWLSTIGEGVFFLPVHSKDILHYTAQSGLSDNAVHSVTVDSSGKLWLGLRRGAINTIEDQNIRLVPLRETMKGYNPIKKLYFDESTGRVWFSSDNSLGYIDRAGKTVYLREADNNVFSIKSFGINTQGRLAMATATGVFILNSSDLVFRANTGNERQTYFPNRSYCVYYDSDNRLWFSNINGLNLYDGKKLERLYLKNTELTKRITDIVELPDNSYALATYGFGVLIYKDGRIINKISIENGLKSNICNKLALDGKFLWIATNNGLQRVEYVNEQTELPLSFQTENGLTSNEVNDILIKDQHIYLATNTGLTILQREPSIPYIAAPPAYIMNFSVNSELRDTTNLGDLQSNQNNIRIQYTTINHGNPSKGFFRYRLKDDAEWIETQSKSLELGSLEPGKYHFTVQARILNSGWGSPESVTFSIKPPVWKTWWFISVLGLVVGFLLFWTISSFFQRKRRQREQQLLTQNKIIALEQQALQAMMNPHFIFNVMNSIQYFINTRENESANSILTGFARLIRKNLDICNKSYITLEEEIEYLNLYLSLEKMRFGDKMKYSVTIDERIDIEDTLIPSMLLQPYVENAIWHGLMPKEEGGEIHVSFTEVGRDKIVVTILDDGVGIEHSQKLSPSEHVSMGMQLTRERVNLLNHGNQEKISISVRQRSSGGTEVVITLPQSYPF